MVIIATLQKLKLMPREARRPSESPTDFRGRVRILIQVLTKVWPPPKASEQFRTKILSPIMNNTSSLLGHSHPMDGS